ncbi:MAG: MOSC domain-containing protein [Alphaproteobacteria bacterium]|nr:MAG: MOSC domain-containing protein [Alphaproteobacteria bacterium]
MKVESLHIYPVKGLRAVGLDAAAVEPRGLAHDRRWMLVDATGKFITQREQPKLATLKADVTDGSLRLSGEHGSITVPQPGAGAERLPVILWKQNIEGYVAAPEASAWFSDFLGTPCRLVWQGDLPRPTSEQYAPGHQASYADGFPLLVTVTASLDDLNRRMPQALPMNRFRPNIVISGAAPWAEDGWKKIRIGAVTLDIVKPCTRCVVTTTDQQTGAKDGNEPLNTLKTFRLLRQPGLTGVVFGQNAVPVVTGTVKVGDAVEVLETQTPPVFVAVA